MTNTYEWFKTTTRGDSIRGAAEVARVSNATLTRQLNNQQLSFDMAIAVARAYDSSVLAALVANGHITSSEAGVDAADTALQAASDEQLVAEVERRIKGSSRSAFDRRISDPPASDQGVADIADRRRKKTDVGGSVEDREAAFTSDIPHEEDHDDYTP